MNVCLWLLLGTLRLSHGDTSLTQCSPCSCKWVSGKKDANCENRQLTTLPDKLSPEIQRIDMSSNNLFSLPSEAFKSVGLDNLHKIILRSCNIQELNKDTFKGLQLLIELDLSFNSIHVLHPETFRDTIRLRVLKVQYNPINKLEDGLFANMRFLQIVDMNFCNLSHISDNAFINTTALHHLHLANNHLEHLQVPAVEKLERLNTLDLQDNPWNCDCHLRSFRDWVVKNHLLSEPIFCSSPPHLVNSKFSDIPSENFTCEPQTIFPLADNTTTEKAQEQKCMVPPVDHSITEEAHEEEVTLSCKVIGNPPPEVYWVVNSRIIPNTKRSDSGHPEYTVIGGGGWVNLTIGIRAQD